MAVTLRNEKVILLKREKIWLSKVAKIYRQTFVRGGWGEGVGGGASLWLAPTIQTSVKFGDIEELYLG